MKDKEKRNKKGSESTIGKIIYGFLLFMPLFAIGVTCGYAIFNKNAYKSFDSSDLIQSLSIPNNINQIQENLEMQFNYKEATISETYQTAAYGFNSISFNPTDYGWDNRDWKKVKFILSSTHQYIYLFDINNEYQAKDIWGSSLNTFSIITNGINGDTSYPLNAPSVNVYLIAYQELRISNVFYYAVDKVTESPLFSWAENSIIYTTTNATCNALSITTPFIPLLLSYWLIISVMYFLYDIALMLIWVLHDRIHALKDSIT